MKQFRLNFAGAYNTRVSAVNAQTTSTGYVGIGIVGTMIVGQTSQSTNKDQRFINCFVESFTDPTGRKNYSLVKRPGFGTFNTPSSGNTGEQILVWTGNSQKVITAFGATNSTIYDSTTSLGAITGKCTGLTETTVGSNYATILASSNDSTAWYYDAGSTVAVMTQITDADFPGNNGYTTTGTFVHLDGFAAIMCTDGTVWASDLNSVTAWTATSFDTANSSPDPGIGLMKHRNTIMAFGTESIEFFYNAGLTPFPFAKIPAMTLKIGAISAEAMTSISDVTFWAGSTPQGGIGVYKYDSGIGKISTPEIDAVLILAGTTNISMTSIRNLGRSFVIVKAASQTFVYCIEENFWHEWTSTTPLWHRCAGTSISGTMVNYSVSNVTTDGKVYIQNHSSLVFTDDSVAYTATAQLAQVDHGTSRKKYYTDLEVVGDTETSTSYLTLNYSDDDYQTWTNAGTVDLSGSRPRWTRLGASRNRAWQLSHTSSTPMRIQCLEGNFEIGL